MHCGVVVHGRSRLIWEALFVRLIGNSAVDLRNILAKVYVSSIKRVINLFVIV